MEMRGQGVDWKTASRPTSAAISYYRLRRIDEVSPEDTMLASFINRDAIWNLLVRSGMGD